MDSDPDGLIVITGVENMRAVQAMRLLRYWKLQAEAHARGFRVPQSMTIKGFNAAYGQKAKTWTDVAAACVKMIGEGK